MKKTKTEMYMKSIYAKILFVTVFLSVVSCVELDEKPVGIFAPDTFFNTKKDAETALLGAYGMIATEALFGRQYTCALEFRSDMTDIGNRGTAADRIQINDFNMDSNNGTVRVVWLTFYQVIAAANATIAGSNSLGLAETEINPIIAEARFIRAFSYYHLVRFFGEIPYIDYNVTDPSSVSRISKTSVNDIYANIITDLEFAKEWLPEKQAGDVRTRASKGTAATYLASVYLTRGEYQNAYDEAKYVIDNKGLFGYTLEADFQNLYRAQNAGTIKETIFAMDFLGQTNSGNQNEDYMAAMTGVLNYQAGFGVNVPALAVYQTWDERDYRRKVSFEDSLVWNGVKEPYTKFTTPRPHPAKWRRFPGNSQPDGRMSDHNYPDFRYAEVLLIAAEALAEVSGVTDEARGYVNEVRARARNWAGVISTFPEDVEDGLTDEEFIDLVLEERRLELAFEWKRWHDIQRRQLGDEVFLGPDALEPRANFDATRDYLFPLPATDLAINPNLKPNNSGY
jgi:hypothetical protein